MSPKYIWLGVAAVQLVPREPCKTCLCVDVTHIAMSKELVSDELWEIIEPLLPDEAPKPQGGGRPRIDDLSGLAGIVFVLKRGILWEMDLPQGNGQFTLTPPP
jgi:hypothetical protein